jgi:hypothetical protein
MYRSRSLVVVLLFVCLSLFVPTGARAQSFNNLTITQVNAPQQFENSVCYEISYLGSVNGHTFEVFPSRPEKELAMDVILAQVVRHLIENEYEANGRYLDETDLKSASPQEIKHLVSRDFISKAWGKSNQKELSYYLQHNSNSLLLFKLMAYLDYVDDKGLFVSGLDVNPVLFRFGQGQMRDRVTIIIINQSDD